VISLVPTAPPENGKHSDCKGTHTLSISQTDAINSGYCLEQSITKNSVPRKTVIRCSISPGQELAKAEAAGENMDAFRFFRYRPSGIVDVDR